MKALIVLAVAAFAAPSQKPVMLSFGAPWCYSCYYMEQRVLSKPQFGEVAKGLVVRKLDIDQPEGAAEKAKRGVVFTPTYILLSADGEKELGRIIGEQTEADFLQKLQALMGGGAIDDAAHLALQDRVKAGDLDVLRAQLKEPAECRMPYLVFKGKEPVKKLAEAPRKELLQAERAALEALADQRLFGAADKRCADFRSGVEALAYVYEALGEAEARVKLLDRAVAALEKQAAAVGEDRSRDDNLRYFLQERGDAPKLRALYERLIAAYATDYVYAFRYAKYLSEQGEHKAALERIEQADRLAYGANRLHVTGAKAKILAALGKKDQAEALLRRDIKAGKTNFPKQVEELEKQLSALASS